MFSLNTYTRFMKPLSVYLHAGDTSFYAEKKDIMLLVQISSFFSTSNDCLDDIKKTPKYMSYWSLLIQIASAPATRGLRNWWLPSPLWHMGGKSPQKQRRPIIIEQN